MADQGFSLPTVEGVAAHNKALSFRVFLNGHTTLASQTGYCQGTDGIALYTQVNSASAPSDANFSGLQSASTPTVIGVYVNCGGRALQLHGVTVPVNTIHSASMTAGVVTNKGAADAITGNTGVTSGGNLAFQVSCTGLDLDAQIASHYFDVDLTLDAK